MTEDINKSRVMSPYFAKLIWPFVHVLMVLTFFLWIPQ